MRKILKNSSPEKQKTKLCIQKYAHKSKFDELNIYNK